MKSFEYIPEINSDCPYLAIGEVETSFYTKKEFETNFRRIKFQL
ncbi:MAG: hypothetical protein ACOX3T_00930 [Bdellovibrionota bacterium]